MDTGNQTSPVVVIGGPTASGKSALALDVARAFDGTVINADSMQLYAELSVLTARPDPEDLERAPHRLYGVLSASVRGSAAAWRRMALDAIGEALGQGRLPVVVGGTGLYLRALMQGLSGVPPVPEEIRQAARARYAAIGGEAFRAGLLLRDPASARLHAGDVTRLTRAWEVLEATGRPLTAWQVEAAEDAPPGLSFLVIVLDPPRDALYAACDRRFGAMIERGALEEVRRLDALRLDPELPAMKALGVPELRAHLHGALTLDDAVAKARQSTRNYAKRQVTWFRHQLAARPPRSAVHGCHTLDSLFAATHSNAMLSVVERVLRA